MFIFKKKNIYLESRKRIQTEVAPGVAQRLYPDFQKKCEEEGYPTDCLSQDQIEKFLGVAKQKLRKEMDGIRDDKYILDKIMAIPRSVKASIETYKNIDDAPNMDFKILCTRICDQCIGSALECTNHEEEYKILGPHDIKFILNAETMIAILKNRSGITFELKDIRMYLQIYPYSNFPKERSIQLILQEIETKGIDAVKYLLEFDSTMYWSNIYKQELKAEREAMMEEDMNKIDKVNKIIKMFGDLITEIEKKAEKE